LNQLVTFLTEERKDRDQAIKDILLSNHPAMEQLRTLLEVDYRVYFANLEDLNRWLSARRYSPVKSDHWDDPLVREWVRKDDKKQFLLKMKESIFLPDGKLKIFTASDWDKNNIVLEIKNLTVVSTPSVVTSGV